MLAAVRTRDRRDPRRTSSPWSRCVRCSGPCTPSDAAGSSSRTSSRCSPYATPQAREQFIAHGDRLQTRDRRARTAGADAAGPRAGDLGGAPDRRAARAVPAQRWATSSSAPATSTPTGSSTRCSPTCCSGCRARPDLRPRRESCTSACAGAHAEARPRPWETPQRQPIPDRRRRAASVPVMRSAKDFFRPLAVGAPEPLREIPARPSRAIHFFDPSNEKMAAKIPGMVGKVDVLLGNLEDAVKADNKVAAREGLVRIAQDTTSSVAGADPAVDPGQRAGLPLVPRRRHHAGPGDRRQARRGDDPEGAGRRGHPLRRPASSPSSRPRPG